MRILLDSKTLALSFPWLGFHSHVVAPARSRRRICSCAFGERGVVGILGATGTGKSKLSIDVGTRFASEVVNSDKMQVYSGLDITTNKMPEEDRRGVPHHLLGEIDPTAGEVSPAEFRLLAGSRVESILSKRKLPVIAGGSNSFVHALLASRCDFDRDPFEIGVPNGCSQKEKEKDGRSRGRGLLRYRCCFLWVDVCWGVLEKYLDRRVEEMIGMGMVEELKRTFDWRRAREGRYRGLEMAIGVPEFDRYFLKYPPELESDGRWREGEEESYQVAVEEIKRNTRVLAKRQLEKIRRLREGLGWEMRRLDATEAVRRKMEGRTAAEVEEAWERDVMFPGLKAVERFLAAGEQRRSWESKETVLFPLLPSSF